MHENQIFVVNVAALRDRDPRVGEIIAFSFPPKPDVDYIKRVVAASGSTIEMRGGTVFLDGKLVRAIPAGRANLRGSERHFRTPNDPRGAVFRARGQSRQ